MAKPISLKLEAFTEGGAVPVDRNLTWKHPRFELFDYKNRAGEVVASTVALHITLVDDDGNEYEQMYSVGDPARFQPNPDDGGKTLLPITEGAAVSKSSNFHLLLSNTVNAGFPQNRLSDDGDVSIFDGLYAHHFGLPEPVRTGLRREVDPNARPRVISVPDKIIRLPWDKKGGAKTATAVKAKTGGGDGEADVAALAVSFIGKHLVDGETSRKAVGAAVFRELAKDPNKDAIAAFIFTDDCKVALMEAGYTVDGEKISKS